MRLRSPILVQPAAVNEEIPAEAEIDMAVRGLKGGRAGGPLGMRAEDLKGWCKEAKRKKNPEGKRWELAVRLVQVTFRDRMVPDEITWLMMVLLPKRKGEYRGIGIVEVLWKVCSVVVNCHLKRSVVLNDALHGFREGRGTGTSSLESKMAKQLVRILQNPLFQVFLDVRKAYDSLDRER